MSKKINLSQFFKMQKALDDEIIKEKHLTGRDLYSKKRLALMVELAEMANEMPESFKFWSNKQNNYENALVELVDCFHFVLSIGLDFHRVPHKHVEDIRYMAVNAHEHLKIEDVFTEFIASAAKLEKENYVPFMNDFLALIDTLGFSWEDFEEAYYKKNEINLARQASGY